jgi:hypothetical protein
MLEIALSQMLGLAQFSLKQQQNLPDIEVKFPFQPATRLDVKSASYGLSCIVRCCTIHNKGR